eukprot:776027-Rhodomonas_salina.1
MSPVIRNTLVVLVVIHNTAKTRPNSRKVTGLGRTTSGTEIRQAVVGSARHNRTQVFGSEPPEHECSTTWNSKSISGEQRFSTLELSGGEKETVSNARAYSGWCWVRPFVWRRVNTGGVADCF